MNLVSITGPESTGKSSLAEALAGHYHAGWVPEYAREYLESTGRNYVYEDILQIAKSQYIREKEIAGRNGDFLFCDTDMLVCKVWSEFVYGKADPWIIRMVREHCYDLYLLCDIDLPWVDDPLREHPHKRKELFGLYLHELQELGVPFEIISGHGPERLDKAISAISRTFKDKVHEAL